MKYHHKIKLFESYIPKIKTSQFLDYNSNDKHKCLLLTNALR